MKPILQVALDFVDLPRALKVAAESVSGGADWIEAGTPLIKSIGLESVRELRKRFPGHQIVADMKTMDVGRLEVETAAKAGANIVCVIAMAPDATIRDAVKAGENYGAKIMVDFLGCSSILKRAREIEKLGADFLGIHISIDEQMEGEISFNQLKELRLKTNLPIAVAGGINSETVVDALNAGADILIVGGAITKEEDAREATRKIKRAMQTKTKIKTKLYKRITEKNAKDILLLVSTANISDAMHREGALKGISPVFSGIKMAGKAFTVRTYPGDWAKPVEAVDLAKKGDVIVVDAGGVGPAVWGELATNSCLAKGIAGVVIDGAIRDAGEIKKLKFSAFSKIITPAAGEPKGFGELNVPVSLGGRKIFPGDWVVGDDDGVVVIPQKEAAEVANRAMDVLERENRLRKEIKDGTTLSKITELLKWEKR
ncbi:MAG: bifunctional hexulose-6-phosphate synthase/ribonuclease regulator [bacterium (Candidatus Ratteibacteria) CG_4_9_14_3_um_filter_41_21]|uniref:3-hexulose-6-phosphate synthase n=2 Tax=Candidatus Ratteibacteria TaxID=2979319 RepID=A0A2M7YFS0_9BACT|nr:MAG: bifunctional hexulose-6-phosphate synthase/ribonuclease regulator [Candidatus Omnitrophica bacterium CG1_02_41_171]PIV63397.1 MAG: bifunctional hexulose-6-phosphate synthase/ribonuclease regulator [bacterium (Candidatus Ratteibacteria) CG01_land_8_20_14_3_00_40_19]PJA61823.1 MAG: bifunctional hexulose-6-phosphate synthase/ribonuclease regulator [bacterium (Candidatus Ratteibacteria) CG_4_9_14_3_um_filter_41_21]